jgi:PAS domain S-box-containing protein
MKHTERLEASPTDDGRPRLPLDAVTDYAIYMLDRDGFVVSWNPGAEHFKGFTAKEIIGEHFSKFYTAEDRTAGLPRRALETASRVGRFETEGWRVRKDGARFWAHVVIDAIRDSAGGLVGFAKITRDLTERRSAEELLRRSEFQFRLLVQNVTDYAIYMLDPSGHVASWNLGAQRIKGYLPDEIIGQHFSRFYTEEDREKGFPQEALAAAARVGRFEKEGWRVRQDGTRFWAHVIIDAIRDDAGALLGFAKITRDITERMEGQRQLEQAREALFQSQKMEAIGQLTGGIAHDFNNLLMVVLASLERVRKRLPDDPRVTPWLDNAAEAAQRGTTLTQRMLAFARRQELKPEPLEVPVLVRGMTNLLQRSLGPSIAIETRFPLALDGVFADANQLELALLNLAVNARDAMPRGGPLVIAARAETVAAGTKPGLPAGRYVCLSVSDTGEGMDAETLARASEPFFTTKGVGKGTGLGLSMVRGVTEQLGGALILKSRKGEGTTAEMWLPAVDIAAPAENAVQAAAAPSDKGVGKLVVLAVDDDRLVLMNTVAMLEDLGHTVFDATSGPRALEVLRREASVDLVITDQAMPQMTGTDLAQAIRAEWPTLPVILATGYAELPPDADPNLRKIGKPFGLGALEQVIAETMAPAESGQVVQFGRKR